MAMQKAELGQASSDLSRWGESMGSLPSMARLVDEVRSRSSGVRCLLFGCGVGQDGMDVEKLVRSEVRRLMDRPMEGSDAPVDDAVGLEVPPGGG